MASRPPLRPGQRDLTTGPIAPALIAFALPTLGSNVLQSLNGSINAIWVGRFLGENAIAATSNANIIMFLMFGAVFGFGMAATILVGQSWGRRDVDAARRAVGSAIGLVLAASVVVGTLGWIFAPEILAALKTPGAAMPLALTYLRVIFVGLPASMLLVLMSMALRGTGDSLTPLWFVGLAVILDSGLNPVFILGLGPAPRLGIAGSATATLIANVVALGALVSWIAWRDLPIRLKGAELRYILPERALVRTIVGKGLPIGAQMLIISVAALTMIGFVNREGVATSAAYGITQQVWAYVQMPALAIGAAVSAMAAQNIGAGRWDRVGRVTSAGLVINLAMTGLLVVAVLLFDRPVLGLFHLGPASLPIASRIGLISTWSFILFGATMVLFGVVRANGAVLGPLLILFVSLFPIRIGLALALRPVLGADALWWSFPAGSVSNLILAVAFYRQGGWRRGALRVPRAPEPEQEASA
ncbi:MATE family efflux transporter, partial [Sphingomonas bacterium]|uniref:MATE family efflux transporter n=1 Tax=Sphingomonas bacterium TaxID=1895847 RepID=UPI0020C6BCFC